MKKKSEHKPLFSKTSLLFNCFIVSFIYLLLTTLPMALTTDGKLNGCLSFQALGWTLILSPLLLVTFLVVTFLGLEMFKIISRIILTILISIPLYIGMVIVAINAIGIVARLLNFASNCSI